MIWTADVCSTAQWSCFPRNGGPNGEICGLEILKEVINLARNNPLDSRLPSEKRSLDITWCHFFAASETIDTFCYSSYFLLHPLHIFARLAVLSGHDFLLHAHSWKLLCSTPIINLSMVGPTLHVQPAFDLWNLNFDLVQSSTIQSVLSLNEYKVVPPQL